VGGGSVVGGVSVVVGGSADSGGGSVVVGGGGIFGGGSVIHESMIKCSANENSSLNSVKGFHLSSSYTESSFNFFFLLFKKPS
jgi:hypothetical protein